MSSERSMAPRSSLRVEMYDHAPTAVVATADRNINARTILSRLLRACRVPDAAHRVDQLGLAGTLQLAAQVRDVHRQVLGVRPEVVTPDPLVDRRVVEHDALVAHEQLEEVEL